MAMDKGFLAGGSGSGSGGSAKKKKKKSQPAKPSIHDIYAVPGAGEARAKAMAKRPDALDYSRFDSIGAREANRDAREAKLKQIPPALRGRLGKAGEDMVLDMAEKMKDNPELRPSPEDVVKQLKREKSWEEGAQGGTPQQPARKAKGSVPVARPTSLSSKIETARSSFEDQMAHMKVESDRLAQQQARLEKMAGDGGPAELLAFLQEQGVSEEDMQVMMTDPSKGMAMLQQAMTKGLGLDNDDAMATKTMEQMNTVDQVTAELKELATADQRGGAKAASVRTKKTRAKAKPGTEAARIQRQIEDAEREMEEARLNAERAAAEHAKMAAQANQVQDELTKLEKEKERAAAHVDAQAEAMNQRGDRVAASELLTAKDDAEKAATAVAAAASANEPRGQLRPIHALTEVGTLADGITALKLEVKLPLVSSFQEVELELTESEVRLTCKAYAPLSIALKHPVNADAAAAKFSKKSHKLRVELPVLGAVRTPAQGQML